ncbi:MAG: hypothetical protein H7039_24215 [Bryobacteraceae bacterium]|nr:hypothetical protein [Bryobacteraceae bacterium]
MSFHTRFVPALLLTASLAFAASATVADPFVGKWQLDKKKTQAKGAPEELQFEIKPKGDNSVIIKSKYSEPKSNMYPLLWVGVMTYELPLSIDGSEKQNQIGPFVHVSKTQIEGKIMTTDWTATLEESNVQGKWIRTVSDDGKEMNLEIIAKASDGRNMDQTLVFRKR